MSNYVDTKALRDALSQASCIKLKMRENAHGVTVYTDDGYEMTFAWCGPSSSYSAHGHRARREMGTRADAALIVALVNAAPALLDELDALRAENEKLKARELEATTDAVLAASDSFTLRRDSDSMLAEIRRLEAECERLREAAERWEYVAWGARDVFEKIYDLNSFRPIVR